MQGDDTVRAAYLGEGEDHERTAPVATSRDGGGTTGPPALELRDVRAGYGTIEVLHGVSLTLPTGSVFALLGPNGAGKSTALKVASGQIAPTSGEVRLFGSSVKGKSSDALARAGICAIPEGRGIFPNLTVTENLRMATYTGPTMAELEDRAFNRFPRLRDRRKQLAGTLSGGEQQMLAMARALTTDPKVLLLDELSMGLAPIVVEELYEIVARIAAEDVSILIVEQFAHEVLDVAETAAIMLHGQIQLTGRPHQIAEELDAAYLGLAQPN